MCFRDYTACCCSMIRQRWWELGRYVCSVVCKLKEAFTAPALPPLDRSDHNTLCCFSLFLFFHPALLQTVTAMRQAATTNIFRNWTPESIDSLKNCFECECESFQTTNPGTAVTSRTRKRRSLGMKTGRSSGVSIRG